MARDDDSDASSVSKSKSARAPRAEKADDGSEPLAQQEPQPLAPQEGPLPQQIKEA